MLGKYRKINDFEGNEIKLAENADNSSNILSNNVEEGENEI